LNEKSRPALKRLDFYTQRTIEFDEKNNSVKMIDQTALPAELLFVNCATVNDIVRSIKTMQIRGAPAIGVAGAMGIVLSFNSNRSAGNSLLRKIEEDAVLIKDARPTAVNLAWGVDQALSFVKSELSENVEPEAAYKNLVKFVNRLADGDVEANKALSKAGSALIPNNASVLTHCN
jgi:methylthioribose-1-phosphate isomerase